MSAETKNNVRIFFDYLFFSLCFVFVGFFLVFGAARWMGYGSDLDSNVMVPLTVVTLP